MIDDLPCYISTLFILTTIATFVLFYSALRLSDSKIVNRIGVFIVVWLLLQAFLSTSNFYNTGTSSFPPKFFLLIGIPLLLILLLFVTVKGRKFVDSLPLVNLTYLNVVRVPVELVLYGLFLSKAVPELMTFSGRNFDILAGLSAPVIAYLCLSRQRYWRKTLLIWNFIALALLINIVVNAVLSAPFPFQQFAFEQPNIAILNFPFTLLPGFIVPVVLFGHLVSIRRLLMNL
jgi:hypothetical protein